MPDEAAQIAVPVADAAARGNFPGWERQVAPEGMQLLSPKDSRSLAVAYAMVIAAESAGDPKAEFSALVTDLVVSLEAEAEGLQRSGLKEIGGMLIEALKLKRHDGVLIDLLLTAYPVGGKWQISFMMYPSSVTDTDPRVIHALDFLATAFNAGYALTDPRQFDATAPLAKSLTTVTTTQYTPAAPEPPTASAPAGDGQRCERRPVWGPQVSAWCYPSGVCNNLVIKDYETVCE